MTRNHLITLVALALVSGMIVCTHGPLSVNAEIAGSSPTCASTLTNTLISTSLPTAMRYSYLPIIIKIPTPTPISTPTKTPTPTNTPGPTDVLVTTSRSFYDSYGRLYLVGVILNNTTSNQHIDDILVVFCNAQGGIVGSCSPSPMAYCIAPGQKTPFKEEVYDGPAVEWVTYTVDVYHNETCRDAPLALSVSNVNTFYDALGDLHIMGRITKEDSRRALWLKVYTTLYDAADEIVNCECTYLPDLDPGQSAIFDIEIDSHEPTTGWTRFELGTDSFVW